MTTDRYLVPGLIAMALLALVSGCDELTVDQPAAQSVEINVACRNEVFDEAYPGGSYCQLAVGEVDTFNLTLELNGVPATGLRLSWFSEDSTGLLVRDGFEFREEDLDSLPLDEYLGLSRQLQSIGRSRGSYLVGFTIDSAGFALDSASVALLDSLFFVEVRERWQGVAAGSDHTCAVSYIDLDTAYNVLDTKIRQGGEVDCWGQSLSGALGTGALTEPAPFPALGDVSFWSVVAGADHTCAVSQEGLLYCWGGNGYGQLGIGSTLEQFAPRLAAWGVPVQAVAAGDGFTCAVAEDLGGEYVIAFSCWGKNDQGQLGCDPGFPGSPCSDGGPAEKGGQLAPTQVVLTYATSEALYLADRSSSELGGSPLAAGGRHACGLEAGVIGQAGEAWCWGDNSYGQLGVTPATTPVCQALDGADTVSFPCYRSAVPVDGPGGPPLVFADIAAGDAFTCAVTPVSQGGEVYCWGRNDYGQLGDGSGADSSSVPVMVTGAFGSTAIRDVEAGADHACALDVEGIAYCWGRNDSGQVGDGTFADRSQAVAVSGGLLFESISLGDSHSCGIASEPVFIPLDSIQSVPVGGGGVYCWGDNDAGSASGKLGAGPGPDSAVPVRVAEPFF